MRGSSPDASEVEEKVSSCSSSSSLRHRKPGKSSALLPPLVEAKWRSSAARRRPLIWSSCLALYQTMAPTRAEKLWGNLCYAARSSVACGEEESQTCLISRINRTLFITNTPTEARRQRHQKRRVCVWTHESGPWKQEGMLGTPGQARGPAPLSCVLLLEGFPSERLNLSSHPRSRRTGLEINGVEMSRSWRGAGEELAFPGISARHPSLCQGSTELCSGEPD